MTAGAVTASGETADDRAAGTGPFHYRAFGLHIQVPVPLPELEPASAGTPDLVFEFGAVDRPDPPTPYGRTYAFDGDTQCIVIGGIGKYLIVGQHRVIFQKDATLAPDLIGFSFLGPVMAAVMHAQGKLVLHGSALAVGDATVLFLGDKGAGKSTTAGALVAAGHALLTDDVVAIAPDPDGAPRVTPAYPMMKLTAAAVAAFGAAKFDILPLDLPGFDKQRARVAMPDGAAAGAVRRIYVLQRTAAGAAPRIVPLASGDAVKALMANAYMARYGREAFPTPAALTTILNQCAALLRHATVATLEVPAGLDRLAEAVALIEHDAR